MATKRKKNDKVRDGFLKDLPEKLQSDIMNIHKIIRNDIDELLEKPAYKDLQNSEWVMSCLDKFKVVPEAKGNIGSARIFRSGKNYKCVIQITDTFRNHQYGWIEDLLNSFINDLYQRVKGPIRRKYDIGLINNGAKGSLDEYFSLELNKKPSEEIWNLWEDKKEKMLKEQVEFYEEEMVNGFSGYKSPYKVLYKGQLPQQLLMVLQKFNDSIVEIMKESLDERRWDIVINPNTEDESNRYTYRFFMDLMSYKKVWGLQYVTNLMNCGNGLFKGTTVLSPNIAKTLNQACESGVISAEDLDTIKALLGPILRSAYDKVAPKFKKGYYTICNSIIVNNKDFIPNFTLEYTSNYAGQLWKFSENPGKLPLTVGYYESDQYFDEMSNRPLKSAFRRVYDKKTGHELQIVYSLKNDELKRDELLKDYKDLNLSSKNKKRLLQTKRAQDPSFGSDVKAPGIKIDKSGLGMKGYITDPEELKEIEKSIEKTGNTDFMSSGHLVKEIIDLETGEKLKEANIIGVIDKGKGYSGGKASYHIKVGDIDHESLYKSTYWPKAGEYQKGKEAISRLSDLELRAPDKFKRGHILHNDSSNSRNNGIRHLQKMIRTNDIPKDIQIPYKDVKKKLADIMEEIGKLNDKAIEILNKHNITNMDEARKNKEIAKIQDEADNLYKKYHRLEGYLEDMKFIADVLGTEDFIFNKATIEKAIEKSKSSGSLKESYDYMKEADENGYLLYGLFEATEPGDAVAGICKLPIGLQDTIKDLSKEIHDELKHLMTLDQYSTFKDSQHDSKDPESKRTKAEDYIDGLTLKNGKDLQSTVGSLIIYDQKDGKGGRILITTEPKFSVAETIEKDADGDNTEFIKKVQSQFNEMMKKTLEKVSKNFKKLDRTKTLKLIGDKDHQYFILELESEYAKKLQAYIENPKANPITEAAELQPDYNKEYNVEMTENQAKRTLATLSRDIINHSNEKDSKYKVTQYTANIYANIITKNLLPKWANGYKKFTITLDSYQSFHTFEFKIPKMSQDFISRYIEGREPLEGFLHRVPEIKVKMSPRIFHTMKDPDDAYNFFKAAIKYYDSKIEKCGKSLMGEVMRMNHSLKHLIATTKLSGLVTYPMQLLFVFDDVNMSNPNTFELSESDLKAVNQFMRNIYTRYAAPEKEKKKIVEDVKDMVKSLHEACDASDNLRQISYLPEAVEKYLFEGYAKEIKEADEKWMNEQIDFMAMRENKDPQVKIMYEKFGVKKLKKIPSDLIAYITIEAESIRDSNDKMMIASYCCSKIEIVEWYIQLLEVGSNKYVVPHTKPWLESMRTQLLACYKKIMAVKITPPSERPIIDIKYPKGYEG